MFEGEFDIAFSIDDAVFFSIKILNGIMFLIIETSIIPKKAYRF